MYQEKQARWIMTTNPTIKHKIVTSHEHGVSNHHHIDCLFNSLLKLTTKQDQRSASLALGLGRGWGGVGCVETDGFPLQMVSDGESVPYPNPSSWIWPYVVTSTVSQSIIELPNAHPMDFPDIIYDIFTLLTLHTGVLACDFGYIFENENRSRIFLSDGKKSSKRILGCKTWSLLRFSNSLKFTKCLMILCICQNFMCSIE